MEQTRIHILVTKFLESRLDASDQQEMYRLLNNPSQREALAETFRELTGEPDMQMPFDESLLPVLDNVMQVDRHEPHVHFLKTVWFRYAAILLLIAGTATYLYNINRPQKEITRNQALQQPDIQPGGNKAILTLSDGSQIVLDSAANGSLASEGGTKIIKLDAGSLTYNAGSTPPLSTVSKVLYNTIRTPKGGQYQITLSDGSRVWLNAASSIRFPTAFVKDRRVEITGEAYLEISKDQQMPFYVTFRDMEVQVLGTSFNINAYPDEATINTTLLEGSIRLNADNLSQLLAPGQQGQIAQAAGGRPAIKVQTANSENVLAWKNGFFRFDRMDLPAIMRQISRWYDIEVSYSGTIPQKEYGGKLPRSIPLNELLKLIEFGDVRLVSSDRHITVIGK